MEIVLKSLHLKNFKGVEDESFEFTQKTFFSGANATGKTTIYDGFLWLLFGKDSQGRSDFQVKPMKDGVTIERKDVEVTGTLQVDGIQVTLQRILKEKWTTKKGEAEERYTGNETLYSINDVPVQMGAYKEYIGGLMQEDTFRLLTKLTEFFRIDWRVRRDLLSEIAGGIELSDVAASSKDLQEFYAKLAGTDADKFKKENQARAAKIREELETMPARISEVSRMLKTDLRPVPEIQAELDMANEALKLKTEALTKLTGAHKSHEEKRTALYQSMQLARDNQRNVRNKIFADLSYSRRQRQQERNEAIMQNDEIRAKIDRMKVNGSNHGHSIRALQASIDQLRDEWKQANEMVFEVSASDTACSKCGQALPNAEDLIQDLRKKFNEQRARRLKSIEASADAKKASIAEFENAIYSLGEEIKSLEASIIPVPDQIPDPTEDEVNKALSDSAEYAKVSAEVSAAESAYTEFPEFTDNKDEARREVQALQERIQALVAERSESEGMGDRVQARIDELKAAQRSQAEALAAIERDLFMHERLMAAYSEEIERRVNSNFDTVSFRMFKPLINGGTEQVCDPLVSGVTYSDANNAARINAGIEVIEVLSKHFGVKVPLFVDNAEAVNNVRTIDTQMVLLIVNSSPKIQVTHG